MGTPASNTLFYGDNLSILREHIEDESVDLVYLDPPFNSNRTYNVLFKEKSGEASPAQMEAFHDTWAWDESAELAYGSLMAQAPSDVRRMIGAMREFIGDNDMMAYLVMMAQRLVELHRVLKPTGSLYLHCDPTVSQYLKVLLDAIFGPRNFRNEITWQRTNVHSDSKRWSDVSDRILYYVKDHYAAYVWNAPYLPLSDEHIESKYRNVDSDGRLFTLSDMTSPNPRPNMMYEWKGHASPAMGWRYSKETMARLDAEGRIWYPERKENRPRLKRYLDEQKGRLLGDVWTDISPINSQAQERLGYPTQKPLALLGRILNASSNPGDVVLDPFCGCGTAIAAAERLGRRWLGIDITYLAIAVMKQRFEDHFPERVAYQVIGDPQDVPSARDLFHHDPFQFQWWAVDKLGIGARPVGDKKKRGADRGIDGEFFFAADHKMRASRGIVQVKGGRPQVKDVRDFRGTMEREQAPIGVFITLEEPTSEMCKEAVVVGYYTSDVTGKAVPRLQLRTVAELFSGHGVEIPALFGAFQQAPTLTRNKDRARTLDLPMTTGPSAGLTSHAEGD